MRAGLMPAAVGDGHALTGVLIDGVLAVDAGPLGWCGPVEAQARVADVLLTHSHVDHLAGLPVFLDNVYGLVPGGPAVHATAATLDALRRDLFNDRLMPDFVGLSARLPAFLRLCPLAAGAPVAVGRYTVTAVELRHSVPTVGYVIDDGAAAVAVLTDTAPCPAGFAAVAAHPRLRAVFLEASFPRAQAGLAAVSLHLTVDQFAAAVREYFAHVAVVPMHVKPRHAAAVWAEIASAGLANVVRDGVEV